MVRRVGVGFVRLEQALQRPVVHGRRGEPARGRGVRAEPVGQCQSRGYGVDLGGGQVLAEQSRRLYVVGGAVVVDADDDADAIVYGQINVYGVTTKSERHKRSYWTRTADGNGIGGRKAPVPYGS